MSVIKRVIGLKVRFGGEHHIGWLPAGAAMPLMTPIRDQLINIDIEFDGYGCLLIYQSQDGTEYGDTWHQTLAEAEQVAADQFGVQTSQWVDA